MFSFLKIKKIKTKNHGLTFIELIVIVGIFAVLSGIVLFNYAGFNTNITLQNLSQEVALKIKQAQTYSLSGSFPYLFENESRPSFGVYFDITKPDSFIIFADVDNNGYFEIGDSTCGLTSVVIGNECLEKINIQTSDRLNELCLNTKNPDQSTRICDGSINNLIVTFKRPFPDALIKAANASDELSNDLTSDASIQVMSSKGKTKNIILWSTGQISVE